MHIRVNGEDARVEAGTSVTALLAMHDLAGRPCAVEVNGDLVPRAEHDTRVLHEGDTIEVVTLVGGG